MSNRHLSQKTHDFPENGWWKETVKGIEISLVPGFNVHKFVISWRSLRAALARKDRKDD